MDTSGQPDRDGLNPYQSPKVHSHDASEPPTDSNGETDKLVLPIFVILCLPNVVIAVYAIINVIFGGS